MIDLNSCFQNQNSYIRRRHSYRYFVGALNLSLKLDFLCELLNTVRTGAWELLLPDNSSPEGDAYPLRDVLAGSDHGAASIL
jgi:hypothetical protein